MGRRWAAVLTVVATGMAVVTLIDPLAFVADDSWFYLVIGENIAQGHGITFSQVMGTNGFQPLWQAVVAGVLTATRLVGFSAPITEMRVVTVVGWALLGLALWRLDALLRSLGVPRQGVALSGFGALVFLGGALATTGSEANLVFLVSIVAVTMLKDLVITSSPSLWAAARVGAVLGVMVLSRLDAGFVAVAALAAMFVLAHGPLRERLAGPFVAGLAAVIVVGPYLMWNVVRFGHLMPIAGAIKVHWSTPRFNLQAIGWTGLALWALILVLAVVAFAGWRPSAGEAVAFLVPAAGAVVSTAVYLLWAPGRFTDLDWYRMPQLLAAAVAGGLAWRRLDPKLAWLSAAGTAVMLLSVPGLLWLFTAQRIYGANHDFWHPVAAAATSIGREVPPGEAIATLDYPGVVAMFSGRNVVGLDGLTGDYAFQGDLRTDPLCALARRDVRWLLVDDLDRLRPVPGGDGAQSVVLTTWLHHEDVGEIVLEPEDQVRSFPDTHLSLWRIQPTCQAGP